MGQEPTAKKTGDHTGSGHTHPEHTSPGHTSPGHTCPWWFIFTFDNPLRRLIHNPEKLLGAYVKPGDRVLDVGCGMGAFTLGLAALVGRDGLVYAADLQRQMLAGLQKRAERAGVIERIRLVHSSAEEIGVNEPVDFALAFWMVHEIRRPEAFLGQIYDILRPDGRLLIAEPRIHVSGNSFKQTVSLAKVVGFQIEAEPKIRASRALLFRK